MKLIAGNVDLSINQGNDLIYYCASGDQYISEAAISIRSLRDIGQFRGKIILFTSKSQVVPSLPCEVIRVECSDWIKIRFTVPFDFSKYNRVMYLDTDIVCIKPIHLLLDKHKTGLVSLVLENNKIRRWLKPLRPYFIESELNKISQEHIINAGTFLCDGSNCNYLFKKWLSTYDKPNDKNDQAALHKLFYDNKSMFSILPRGIVCMPIQEREHSISVLVHYCGLKDSRLTSMRLT